MTAREYVSIAHRLCCVICFFKLGQRTPCQEAHHVVPGDDWSVCPLCYEHHQGATGVHGKHRVGFYRFWKVDDRWLLARTAELFAKELTI